MCCPQVKSLSREEEKQQEQKQEKERERGWTVPSHFPALGDMLVCGSAILMKGAAGTAV